MIMCWAHACRKMKDRLRSIVKKEEIRKNILNDIQVLQLSQNKEIFEKAAKLFMKKHESQVEFIKYFHAEWIANRSEWYEGAAANCPSTNNAQESYNRVIKDVWTKRNRMSTVEANKTFMNIIHDWSESLGGEKPFADDREISAVDIAMAKIWLDEQIPFKTIMQDESESGNRQIWYVQTKDTPLNQELIQQINKKRWSTFDEFKITNFSACRVVVEPPTFNSELDSYCNCREYFKNYKCNHSLGFQLHLGYRGISDAARKIITLKKKSNIVIGRKKSKGRPKKAKNCLSFN